MQLFPLHPRRAYRMNFLSDLRRFLHPVILRENWTAFRRGWRLLRKLVEPGLVSAMVLCDLCLMCQTQQTYVSASVLKSVKCKHSSNL